MIELESHGREAAPEEMDLSRSVGWFTCLYPVRLMDMGAIDGTIKQIKETLRQVPEGGIGFGIQSHPAAAGSGEESLRLPRPRLTFNYLGQFESQMGEFTPAVEACGAERDPASPLGNWIEINGQIINSRLELHWHYSRAMYRVETIESRCGVFRDAMLELLVHCASGDVAGVTPSDFPLAGLNQQQLDALAVPARAIDDIFPLSPLQQGLLFHSRYTPESTAYINQLALSIDGLDLDRFVVAWEHVMARHDVLRSCLLPQSDAVQPLQIVHKQLALPIEIVDWQERLVTSEMLADYCEQAQQRGFDLIHPPLWHLALLRLSPERYYMIWTSHHLLLDGWSSSALLGEVLKIYGNADAIRSPALRYRDYIDWLGKQDTAASESFWKNYCGTLEEPTLLAQAVPPVAPAGGNGVHTHRCMRQ
jgi:non-ribosomal peptide synthase protein (TIGR01720 family)